jgi:predicted alpha/beta-fold hydrolase
LPDIVVPTLIVNAKDDPIVPPHTLEDFHILESVLSKGISRGLHFCFLVTRLGHLIYLETKYGGHLGWFQGGFFLPDKSSWAEHLILLYFSAFR